MADRPTVDDALISTDVDRLIQIISTRRIADVRQLEKESGLKRQSIEEWLQVLENEGYIAIDYRLTNIIVRWIKSDENITVQTATETTLPTGMRTQIPPATPATVTPAIVNISADTPEAETPRKEGLLERMFSRKNTPVVREQPAVKMEPETPAEAPRQLSMEEKPLLQEEKTGSGDTKAGAKEGTDSIATGITDSVGTVDETPGMDEKPKTDGRPGVPAIPLDIPYVPEAPYVLDSSQAPPARPVLQIEEVSPEMQEDDQRPTHRPLHVQDATIRILNHRRSADLRDHARHEASRLAEEAETSGAESEPEDAEPLSLPASAPATGSGRPSPTFYRRPGSKEALSSVVEEVRRQKKEIERLKSEKVTLYQEEYASLEKDMEQDMTLITDRILEKESRLVEIKERLLDLPDRVTETQELMQKMEKVRQEGRVVLEQARTKVEAFLKDLEKRGGALEQQMVQSRQVLAESREKAGELDQWGGQMEEQMEGTRQQMERTRDMVAQLQERLQELDRQVEENKLMKERLEEARGQIEEIADEKEKEMDSLEEALGEVRKVGEWTREYLNDYETKIEEIERYALQNEQEFDQLREAAEVNQMKRYLQELEGLSEDYSGRLGKTMESEEEINQRLDQARNRLRQLLLESQQAIRRLSKPGTMPQPVSFDEMIQRSRARRVQRQRVVEEKEMEQDRLVEDIRRVREKARIRKGRRGKKK